MIEVAHDARSSHPVGLAGLDQIEVQQILAGIAKRTGDAVARGIPLGPAQHEAIAAERGSKHTRSIEHNPQRAAVGGDAADRQTFFARIANSTAHGIAKAAGISR